MSPKDISPQLAFTIEYVDTKALGIPFWEAHQIQFLNNTADLTIDNKSRQVGWSFIAAMDALASAVLFPNSICIFLSINQDEANNKIRYFNIFEDALDSSVRLHRLTDNKSEIIYENGSRVKSLPCKSPRGYAQPRIYVDEFAHYPKDDDIYQGLLPAITRGGVVRIGSSPLGARGKFYDIFSQHSQTYSGYNRRKIPWWTSEGLCTNITEAVIEAPKLKTVERVDRWATPRLKILYENHFLEDFQQEYECAWLDDSISWIDWELIKRNQEWFMINDEEFGEIVHIGKYESFRAEEYIDNLASEISAGNVAPVLFGGMDVGRRNNNSEIILISEEDDKYPLRLNLTLDSMEFADQRDIIRMCLSKLPIDTFMIDESGLGMDMAETLEKEYSEVIGVSFTPSTKTDIAVKLKIRFENQFAPIPLNKTLASHIHSIKKVATPNNNIIFRAEGTKKHHADKFWALGLAHLASEEATDSIGLIPYNISNYRGQRYGV